MTTLTIPYTLEDDNGAIAPDYRPEAAVPMRDMLELFDELEAADVEDDTIRNALVDWVQEAFVSSISPVVSEIALASLVQQVRAALVARDSAQALPDPA